MKNNSVIKFGFNNAKAKRCAVILADDNGWHWQRDLTVDFKNN